MLVSLDWLKEIAGSKLGVKDVDKTLTMLGLEVEGTEAVGGDYVLEVNVTPNRPDCLSIVGIARELAAATHGGALNLPKCKIAGEAPSDFKIEILDSDLCQRYAGRVIRGVKAGESPDWMKERLHKCGIRSINNIVDITNYVLLEFGHPLHAFDLATLKGPRIRVARAGKGQSIATLDGVKRDLPENALLIWDAERPVAVAGVMGGAETEVTMGTDDILLESAYFKPQSVRRTSRALGLKTESSFRFERGTDILGLETALDRAASLVLEIAGGKAEVLVDAYPVKFSPTVISVRHEKVSRVLGANLGRDKVLSLLNKLGLKTEDHGEHFTLTAPSFRVDLSMDADVIEEVARLYGYGNIPTAAPVAAISTPKADGRRAFVLSARDMMLRGGFDEAISYSFMNGADLDTLSLDAGDKRRSAVRIKNPLRQEEALLRTTLAPALIGMFTHNFFRGSRDIRMFEIARVFYDIKEVLPEEGLRLGGVYCRERAHGLWKEAAEDFYIVKGAIDAMLEGVRIKGCGFKPSTEPFLHPGKSADVYHGARKIGYMGALSPSIVDALDLKSSQEVIIFELDLDALIGLCPPPPRFSAIARFPHADRDLALLIDMSLPAADIMEAIRSYPSELIEEVRVFDSYRGAGIPQGRKSLAFSIRYRASDRTLTDEEIEALHRAILDHLRQKTGAEIRGA